MIDYSVFFLLFLFLLFFLSFSLSFFYFFKAKLLGIGYHFEVNQPRDGMRARNGGGDRLWKRVREQGRSLNCTDC